MGRSVAAHDASVGTAMQSRCATPRDQGSINVTVAVALPPLPSLTV